MFSASDAAFSGFRVGRGNWGRLLVWSVIMGAVSIGSTYWMVSTVGPQLQAFQTMGAGGAEPSPAESIAMLQAMGPFLAIGLPLSLVYYSVFYAGVNRLVLRPGDGGLAGLKLGGDEVRQFLVMLCLVILFFLVGVLGGVAVGLLTRLAMGALGGGAAAAVGILTGLAVVAGLVVLAVRLSLAPAQTFDTGRLNVFGSWALTRGHFWPMLGAYVLSFVMLLIVWILFMAIVSFVAVTVGGGFGAMSHIFSPDISSIASLYTPGFIAYEVIAAFAAPYFLLIARAPAPTIYRALTSGA